MRSEKDGSRHYDNTHSCFLSDASYDGVLAKVMFLRVNHGHWDSGKNTHSKFFALHDVVKVCDKFSKSAESYF